MFVVPARRERLILFLGSPKQRTKATGTLAHFGDWNPRWIVRLPAAAHSPSSIERELRRRGAGDSCHVISENSALDGKRLPLGEALRLVVGHGMGTLISCVPARLAFYEGEGPSDRCILEGRGR